VHDWLFEGEEPILHLMGRKIRGETAGLAVTHGLFDRQLAVLRLREYR
jgi:hypothetical protein